MTEQEALAAAEYDVHVYRGEDRTWGVEHYGFLSFDVRPRYTAYFTRDEAIAERRVMIEKLVALQLEHD